MLREYFLKLSCVCPEAETAEAGQNCSFGNPDLRFLCWLLLKLSALFLRENLVRFLKRFL
jgi:hypothetical protein